MSVFVDTLVTAGRRGLSLIDCSSVEVMRRLAVRECLAFDRRVEEQGFRRPVYGGDAPEVPPPPAE